MKEKMNMWEFVPSNCEAMKEPEKFFDDWRKTNSNPCSICGTDKFVKCSYYKNLVGRGVIGKEKNPP
jgi:hypothetical protein